LTVLVDRGSDDVDLQAQGDDAAQIDPDSDGRFLLTADGDQAHHGDPGEPLREDYVGVVVVLRKLHGV